MLYAKTPWPVYAFLDKNVNETHAHTHTSLSHKRTHAHRRARAHTHTHIYIYIYIYMFTWMYFVRSDQVLTSLSLFKIHPRKILHEN